MPEKTEARLEYLRTYMRTFRRTEEGKILHRESERKRREQSPERHREANRRYRQKYPEKHRARLAVYRAIRSGKLTKQQCEVCGDKAEAHHEDYAKALDVRWLCRAHHKEHHRIYP